MILSGRFPRSYERVVKAKFIGNKFKKLTLERNIDLGIYEDALNYALSEEDVRNIAVSSAYGAGKSSVILVVPAIPRIRTVAKNTLIC